MPKSEIKKRVLEAAEQVNLQDALAVLIDGRFAAYVSQGAVQGFSDPDFGCPYAVFDSQIIRDSQIGGRISESTTELMSSDDRAFDDRVHNVSSLSEDKGRKNNSLVKTVCISYLALSFGVHVYG